jgi:hypothetical protein
MRPLRQIAKPQAAAAINTPTAGSATGAAPALAEPPPDVAPKCSLQSR